LDQEFVKDIFFAELELNTFLKECLRNLARNYIEPKLRRYVEQGYVIPKKGNSLTAFKKLKKVQHIEEILYIRGYAKYLLMESFKFLNEDSGRKNYTYPLYNELCSLLKWNGVDESEERILASQTLPNPHLRLGRIQIRVTTGLGRKIYGKERGCIVFEVYPSPAPPFVIPKKDENTTSQKAPFSEPVPF
jgi:hypothetical protein